MFDDINDNTRLLLGLLCGAGIKFAAAWWLRQRRKSLMERVGTVKEIIVYPLKSCKGVYVQEADCARPGLCIDGSVVDRHWMLMRPNCRFLSQRQDPKMALISVQVKGGQIEISAPGKEPFVLPDVVANKHNVIKCSVFDGKTEGVDCGEEAAKWVSDFLGTPGLRVVHHTPDLRKRNFIEEGKPWQTRAAVDDYTGFADWASYLLIPSASLTELNNHLNRKLTMRSFRPNIVVDGTIPFDEDNWEEIQFGDKVHMRCLDACTRCVLTTVDPDKGIKQEDGEPLETLRRIRKIPPYDKFGECAFGINLAPDVLGTIKVGDPVYVIRSNRE